MWITNTQRGRKVENLDIFCSVLPFMMCTLHIVKILTQILQLWCCSITLTLLDKRENLVFSSTMNLKVEMIKETNQKKY